MSSTPHGITPPAPGLEREEPDLWIEDDIPSDDGEVRPTARSERSASREERPHKPERE